MRNRLLLGVLAIIILTTIVGVSVIAMNRSSAPQASHIPPTPTNADTLLSSKNTAIVTNNVTYFQQRTGFYAAPKASGNYPGVVMIHEWWGLNDQIKTMAQTLAKEGYQVLAVDLYGSVATTTDQARQQSSSLNQTEALQNLKAAVTYLHSKGAPKVASLGWCFGGGQSLQLSLSGVSLDATVIYYGSLVTDSTKLAAIKWPVLGIFGGKDTSIPPDQVKAFERSLNQLHIKNSITIYPGVGHAFANPSNQNYAPGETRDAWNKTLKFLEENLKS